MNTFCKGIRILLSLAVAVMLAAVLMPTPVNADGPDPRIISNDPYGSNYGAQGAEWWQWAFSFTAEDLPFFNQGGPVDLSAGQSGHTWFLAGANAGLPNGPRTGTIPANTSLFFPLFNLVNDYPCPPQFGFEPAPGQSLKDFLQTTGNDFLDAYLPDSSTLFAEVDGVPLANLSDYRATSNKFKFTADATLNTFYDPCITGTTQDGVALGYWLWLAPLSPGEHTLHFGARSLGFDLPDQDITYIITVEPGR